MAGDNGFSCPFTNLYAAYSSGHEYFPPNHPRRPPPPLKPEACFEDAAAAERAGYSLAPVPPGDELVAGIYLMPIDLTARCRLDAHILGFAVPCPTLVPNRPAGGFTTCERSSTVAVSPFGVPCVAAHAFDFEYEGFLAPPDYPTPFLHPDGTIHRGPSANLIITAFIAGDTRGPEPQVEYFLACTESQARGSENVPSSKVHGPIPAVYYLCLPGGAPPQGGQLILRWKLGRVTYQVSLHEDTPGNRELLLRIASAIDYASPPT